MDLQLMIETLRYCIVELDQSKESIISFLDDECPYDDPDLIKELSDDIKEIDKHKENLNNLVELISSTQSGSIV